MPPDAQTAILGRRARFLQSYMRILKNQTYVPLWLGQPVSNLSDTLNYLLTADSE